MRRQLATRNVASSYFARLFRSASLSFVEVITTYSLQIALRAVVLRYLAQSSAFTINRHDPVKGNEAGGQFLTHKPPWPRYFEILTSQLSECREFGKRSPLMPSIASRPNVTRHQCISELAAHSHR